MNPPPGGPRRRRRLTTSLACLVAGLSLLPPGFAAAPTGPRWESAPGHRWAVVSPGPAGHAGFTLLPSEATGIRFTNHLAEASAARNRVYENGSGVALGDVDGDELCDIYFGRLEGPNVLYRNLGNWRFENITERAGIALPSLYSSGAVFADVDGDGDLDLVVTSLGHGARLFLNDGNAVFTESARSGILPRYAGTSMALGDIDGDADLDLYVANYRTTNYKDAPPGVTAEAFEADGRIVVKPEDRFDGIRYKNGGIGLVEKGEPDILYVNKGDGRFGPISWAGGAFVDEDAKPLAGPPREWGLSVMFRDLNGDRTPDIYVCNDFIHSRDRLWLNEGGRRFRSAPRTAQRNQSMSSMAIDFADINRDGFDDFIVVDMLSREHLARQRQRMSQYKGLIDFPRSDPLYQPEVARNTLHLNRGDGSFAEIAQLAGLEATEWSWGAIFLDVDLDGYEDLLVANGNDHDSLDADLLRRIAAPAHQVTAEQHLANLRLFPRLATPNLLFRNRGDLTFEEVGVRWGFAQPTVSHGMALADLDNDGDLDVVVNNLHEAAGIYRNDSTAPRVAVRLAGKPGNTRGIGARIRLLGGPVPIQAQEMICGGRYLSGDDAMRVFAAGSPTNVLSLEVAWRGGKSSLLRGVQPNRIYEIREVGAEPEARPAPPAIPATRPLFIDLPGLAHVHQDDAFDDLARQPTLTFGLGHLGPGVTWFDLDGDGWDDLILGAGRGGRLAMFRNNHAGAFLPSPAPAPDEPTDSDQTTVLAWNRTTQGVAFAVGVADYEDSRATAPAAVLLEPMARRTSPISASGQSSTGPLALADIDGDGELDLFLGGRVVPGQYPSPAASQLLLGRGGRFVPDAANAPLLAEIGLVSGATFSDLDADGRPELILACEWGPVRVCRFRAGRLVEATADLGLAQHAGWWNGVATGDFDGDGRRDIVASNLGRNSRYQRHLAAPVRVYYGDFNEDGVHESIEAYFDPALRKIVPFHHYDLFSQVFPEVLVGLPTYRAFGSASVTEILGPKFKVARETQATTVDSMLFLNRGDHFEPRTLPVEAQFSRAFGIAVADWNGDGHDDLFLAQNFFDVDAELSRFDAGTGLVLLGDGRGGFKALSSQQSGIDLPGEQRGCAVADFDRDGRPDLCVAQNRGPTRLFRNATGKPGLRVRLKGPANNPQAIGASFQIQEAGRPTPRHEIQVGSGYWSQDSAVQVVSGTGTAATLVVRWPGGRSTTSALPVNAREIEVDLDGKVHTVLP